MVRRHTFVPVSNSCDIITFFPSKFIVGNRLFGNNYFEAFLDKGKLKPLLVKKALLGVGAVGAAGVAALVAKKIHESKGHFGHGGQGQGGWYPEYPQAQAGAGWYPSSNDYSQGYGNGNVNFPSAGDYQYQNQYQYPAGQAYDNGYDGYTDSSYSSQGYNGWSR